MKPKLAHIDVTSKSGTQLSSESSEQSEGAKIQRRAVTREKSTVIQPCYYF